MIWNLIWMHAFISANFACYEAYSDGGMPVQIWMKTGFNVNAKHGGGTALVLISRTKSDNDGCELQLIRCGFDGNHMEYTSVAKGGTHSIYEWNEVHTTSKGDLCQRPCLAQHTALFFQTLLIWDIAVVLLSTKAQKLKGLAAQALCARFECNLRTWGWVTCSNMQCAPNQRCMSR